MITKRTVLVLGAGSNECYGFPVGTELYRKVCLLWQQGVGIPGWSEPGKERVLRERLPRSGVYSVDEFLEDNPHLIGVGKCAVAYALLPSEGNDLFNQRDLMWYQYLLAQIRGEHGSLEGNQLVIVTFNYDRSLEHYLFNALCSRYGFSDEVAARELQRIPIIHVHGQLGYLPWQTQLPGFDEDLVVPYGGIAGVAPDETAARVMRAAECVRIICEPDVERDERLASSRKHLQRAELVLFLGFGYHATNMRRLGFEGERVEHRQVCGTCLGMENPQRRRIHNMYGVDVHDTSDIYLERASILEYLRKTGFLEQQ